MARKKAVRKKVAKKKATAAKRAGKKGGRKKAAAGVKKKTAASARDKPADILKYIKLAIETEKRGIKFYTDAKRMVDDVNMNMLMDVLLEQEKIHLKFFTDIYKAEKWKGGKEAAAKAAEYRKQTPIKNPLFKIKKMHDIIRKKGTIYHLFNQAVEFEQDGHDLYMDIAKKVKDPKIKKFLKMVAHEELRHRDFIMQHQDAIYSTGHWFGWEHVRLES